ncbi:MAG: polysaccharide deacetylase family protein [Phycisphaeraceae bacterium]|nr:polysaccharide deacetylase family protein [Phycisphaeraceae bacterium]
MNFLFTVPMLLALMLTTSVHGQSTEVVVCGYRDNKQAALSLTFDDGLRVHYTIVKPLLAKYGYKGTFYIVEKWAEQVSVNRKNSTTRRRMCWDEIKELANEGHEIGNHSYSHIALTRIDPSNWNKEINHPIATFEEKLGVTPITFCFPGNARNDAVLQRVLQTHINARTHQYAFGGDKYSHKAAVRWVDQTLARENWGVAMIHAITHEGHGFAPFPNDEKDFVMFLDHLKTVDDKLWIDTFANVSKYTQLRDHVTVQWDKPDQIFTLKTDLDTHVYDISLTVKLTAEGKSKIINVKPNTATTLNW